MLLIDNRKDETWKPCKIRNLLEIYQDNPRKDSIYKVKSKWVAPWIVALKILRYTYLLDGSFVSATISATEKVLTGERNFCHCINQLLKTHGSLMSLTLWFSCHFTKISQQLLSLLEAKTRHDYINLVFLGKWIKTFLKAPGGLTCRKKT